MFTLTGQNVHLEKQIIIFEKIIPFDEGGKI